MLEPKASECCWQHGKVSKQACVLTDARSQLRVVPLFAQIVHASLA